MSYIIVRCTDWLCCMVTTFLCCWLYSKSSSFCCRPTLFNRPTASPWHA